MDNLTPPALDFLVSVIELTADAIFNGDKGLAYIGLKNAELLAFYAETYDTSHTLSSNYLISEIKDNLQKRGITG